MKYLGTIELQTLVTFQPCPKILGNQQWPKTANNVLALPQNSRYPKLAKNSPKKPILGHFESLKEKNCYRQQGMDWHSKITHTNNVLAMSENSRYPKFAKNSPKTAILGYFESLKGNNCHRQQGTDWYSKITHTNNVSALSQSSGYPKLVKNSP